MIGPEKPAHVGEGAEATDDVQIREARESDAAALIRLKRRVFLETDNLLQTIQDYDFDREEERALIRRYRVLGNCGLFLAFDGRDPVGFLTLQGGVLMRNRHVAQLGVAVRQDYWRRGVGRRLMERGIAWARQHPALRKVSLLVYADNSVAIGLYERLGFQHEGLLKNEVHLEERRLYMDLVAMGLQLKES